MTALYPARPGDRTQGLWIRRLAKGDSGGVRVTDWLCTAVLFLSVSISCSAFCIIVSVFLFLQVSLKYQSDLLKLIQTVTFSPFYITGNRSV